MSVRRRNCAIRMRVASIALIILEMVVPPPSLLAMPRLPSLVELTRSASVIALVEIRQFQKKMIVAHVREVIKGQDVPPDMNILWDFESNVEVRVAHREVGEQMIVFVNRKGNLFETTFADSSLVSVAQLQRTLPNLEKYKRAIEEVMRYDAAASPDERAAVLLEMLKDDYFSQDAAIGIIYLEKPRDYPVERLVGPLTTLAKDEGNRLAVRAVQALGRIADKTLVPTFIELLGSGNVYVRETAYHILKDKTAAPLPFDPRGAEEQRNEDIRHWSQWWQENKERVQLRY